MTSDRDEQEFSFQWHLTDRCNLRCGHCYQEAFDPRRELSPPRLAWLADRLLEAFGGCRLHINLTGGEPLLYPQLEYVLERLEREPAVTGFSLITNATLWPPRRLEFLAACPKLQFVKVSVEGADEAHNVIRGAGSLQRALNGIERFRRLGQARIVLMVTLARWNLEQIGPLVALARQRSLAGIIFERFVPLGVGHRLADGVLDPVGWRRACRLILQAAGEELELDALAGCHAFWLDFAEGLRTAACNLGRSLALMPDGEVYPCRRLPLGLGNLLQLEPGRLRKRVFSFAPEKLKPRLQGVYCSGCPVEGCAGCRALASAVGGRLMGDDPCCVLLAE